ncbi:phosphohistidine phosphatase SixA [Sphingobium sp. SYK-6]|uniref:SixA phosphatase family protein n=1 Tax=Sphingobium sp. (strain NBRC 103272 / SYK-6) TaxID=627192 RepID=UPI000227699E|nr:histidine phosphatase family protein [Sphingobium sp. SYK-6]BAK65362.1 phosphohistidine phosphatase SixA [Sphingobium sp. SYK-6]
MKRVIVLRHAKSDWSDAALRDFDRSLNDRGHRAAAVMGRWAAHHGLTFDAIIASPAARVVDTLRHFREAYGECPEPAYDLRIYLAAGTTLAEVLAETQEPASSILLAGHSPGLEELILTAVPDDARSPLRDSVETKFPTAALAVLDFDVTDWASLAHDFAGRATLRSFVRPRDLDPALGPDQR